MKNNLRKLMSIFLSGVFLFALIPVVNSQNPNLNTEVVGGSIGFSDYTTFTTEPSSEYGGILSVITETIRENVLFGVSEFYAEEHIYQIQNFDVLFFPVGSTPNFENVIIGTEFLTSEPNVELRNGAIGTYTTFNIESVINDAGTDYQIPIEIFGQLDYIDGSYAIIQEWDLTLRRLVIDTEFDTGLIITSEPCNSNPSRCLTASETASFFGITEGEIQETGYATNIIPSVLNSHIFAVKYGNEWKFISNYDLSADFVYDLEEPTTLSGFSTSTTQSESLALLPVGLIDCWAII